MAVGLMASCPFCDARIGDFDMACGAHRQIFFERLTGRLKAPEGKPKKRGKKKSKKRR